MSGHDQVGVIEAARAGDEAAWETLYRSIYPKLHAFLSRRVGIEQAEDVLAETMSRAVAGINSFTLGPSGFDGWVFGIARHVVVDHHREKVKRRSEAMVGSHLTAELSYPVDTADRLVLGDDYELIRRLFSRLDQSDQELLELRVIAGLSAEQTAAVLKKRPGAVRTAQSRALGRLRQLMEAHDG